MVIALADDSGCFPADAGVLAGRAGDLLGAGVAPSAVAACLRWSVAARITDRLPGTGPARYRLRIRSAAPADAAH